MSRAPCSTSRELRRWRRRRTPAFLAPLARDRVWIAVGDDGVPWARGSTYKAHFGHEGAAYAPFVGSDAPADYPVRFTLASVTVGGAPLALEADAFAALDGESVRYARGPVVETYHVGPDSIEQTFAFEDLPARGELVLRIAVETELEGRELPERIEFANERGAVRYGRATTFDAGGRSVAAPTTLTAAGDRDPRAGGLRRAARACRWSSTR